MQDQLKKLIDLKSIITIILVITLVFMIIYSMINGALTDNMFLLFSNIITMVVTYFFTKKKTSEE